MAIHAFGGRSQIGLFRLAQFLLNYADARMRGLHISFKKGNQCVRICQSFLCSPIAAGSYADSCSKRNYELADTRIVASKRSIFGHD